LKSYLAEFVILVNKFFFPNLGINVKKYTKEKSPSEMTFKDKTVTKQPSSKADNISDAVIDPSNVSQRI